MRKAQFIPRSKRGFDGGKIMDFNNKIILAPMAGVSDYAFRRIAREHGADFCVSEMVSAKAMEFNDKKTGTLASIKGAK